MPEQIAKRILKHTYHTECSQSESNVKCYKLRENKDSQSENRASAPNMNQKSNCAQSEASGLSLAGHVHLATIWYRINRCPTMQILTKP